MQNPGRSLLVVIALAGVVRLALLCVLIEAHPRSPADGPVFTPDSWDYWSAARSLRLAGRFATSPVRPLREPGRLLVEDPGPAEVFRTPGYPAFLAAWARVVPLGRQIARVERGQVVSPGWGVYAVLGAQVALDVALVALVYLLGKALIGQSAGLAGAALQAVAPVSVTAGCRLLSDAPYALLLTASAGLLAMAMRDPRRRWPLTAGACLGVATYVRAVGLVMAPVFLVAIGLTGRGRWQRAGLFAAVYVALVSPWIVRNAVTAGYRGFSSSFVETLFGYVAPHASGGEGNDPGAELRDRLTGREPSRQALLADDPAGPGLPPVVNPRTPSRRVVAACGPAEVVALKRRIAATRIGEHPLAAARAYATGAPAFWLPGVADVLELLGLTSGQRGTLSVLHREGLLSAVSHYLGGAGNVWAVAAVVAAVVAIWCVRMGGIVAWLLGAIRRPGRVPSWAWAMAAMVALSFAVGGPATTPRFRVPVAGLLSLACGAVWARWRAGRRGVRVSGASARTTRTGP